MDDGHMLPSPNGISFFEKSLPSYLLLPVVAVSKDETFCLTKIIRRKKKSEKRDDA